MYIHINNLKLPSYLSIEIKQQGDTKYVYVNSSIHVNKQLKVPYSYSLDWTDEEILRDEALYNCIKKAYGLKTKVILE